jgi:phage tail-like protein
MKYTHIVLKRGYTADGSLWKWRQNVIDGKVDRRPGSITLLDDARNTALKWEFREGWPAKLEGPGLNAKTSEVAIETLEICHEGIELAS